MQDLNSGKEWSEMDIADLTHWMNGNLAIGRLPEFPMRSPDEVKQKINELKLTKKPLERIVTAASKPKRKVG
jgi:hypothetical protein